MEHMSYDKQLLLQLHVVESCIANANKQKQSSANNYIHYPTTKREWSPVESCNLDKDGRDATLYVLV